MATAIDTLAPNSPEAEEALLACVLIAPDCMVEVEAFVSTADFFVVRNGWLYTALLDMRSRGEAVDILTVSAELKRRNQLDDFGGLARLTYLINNCPTHIHVATYGKIVERASIRRKLLGACQEIGQVALEESTEIDEIIYQAEEALARVTRRAQPEDIVSIGQYLPEHIKRLENISASGSDIIGLATGYRQLDDLLRGLRPATMYAFGARPGVGKTTFLLNIIRNVLKDGRRVALFSLEMERAQIWNKLLSAQMKIESDRIEIGKLSEKEWYDFQDHEATMREWRLYLDDTAGITPERMARMCHRIQREVGLDMVVVDYLQLMRSGRRTDNRVAEVSEVSRSLQELSRELGVPVVTAVQLNRGLEGRSEGDRRPRLSDIRESGSIEQDSAVVCFLYRDEMVNQSSPSAGQMEIIVAKNRYGKTGTANVLARLQYSQFLNLDKSAPVYLNGGDQ